MVCEIIQNNLHMVYTKLNGGNVENWLVKFIPCLHGTTNVTRLKS